VAKEAPVRKTLNGEPEDVEEPGLYLDGKGRHLVNRFPAWFADAEASFDEARFVIAGLPYDSTVSYRHGTALGPDQIRQAAWNIERWNVRNGVDLGEVPVHDMGNLDLAGLSPEKMFETVRASASRVARAGKFPLFLGGEHSTIPPVVHALKEKYPDLGVLQLDAHLDYRREYHGSIDNHACAMRRIADAVGPDKIAAIGIRSVEKEEHDAAVADGFRFWTSFDVHREGMGPILHKAMEHLGSKHLYVTLDIDGIDPAFAPATGTPEPFGLSPFEVLQAITRTAPHMVGFDVNEVSPAWDFGNTASLAAKLAREVIGEVWSGSKVFAQPTTPARR
jgi:agmatinase